MRTACLHDINNWRDTHTEDTQWRVKITNSHVFGYHREFRYYCCGLRRAFKAVPIKFSNYCEAKGQKFVGCQFSVAWLFVVFGIASGCVTLEALRRRQQVLYNIRREMLLGTKSCTICLVLGVILRLSSCLRGEYIDRDVPCFTFTCIIRSAKGFLPSSQCQKNSGIENSNDLWHAFLQGSFANDTTTTQLLKVSGGLLALPPVLIFLSAIALAARFSGMCLYSTNIHTPRSLTPMNLQHVVQCDSSLWTSTVFNVIVEG